MLRSCPEVGSSPASSDFSSRSASPSSHEDSTGTDSYHDDDGDAISAFSREDRSNPLQVLADRVKRKVLRAPLLI